MKPNIFKIATKELTQDAFITWLLLFADNSCKKVDPELNKCAQDFVSSLIRKKIECFDEPINRVVARRQWEKIDVSAKVNGKYLIIIEDKTNTGTHDNQLQRYKQFSENWCKENNYESPICVYLKTGNESKIVGIKVEELGYYTYYRKDFIKLMRKYSYIKNEIFSDFLDRLNTLEFLNDQFTSKLIGEWDGNDWQGFFQNLEEEINLVSWHFVNNIGGGFWNAVLNWDYWGKYPVYLQIEQGKLCVKISTDFDELELTDGMTRSRIRNMLHNLIMHNAREKGESNIKKPKRFGSGKYMTVAIVPCDIWLGKNDEIIQMEKVVNNLKKYLDFVNSIIYDPANIPK